MHPVIYQIGPFTIYAYGTMLALAIIVCAFLLQRDARRAGVSADACIDVIFWAVVGGIAGGRLMYVILDPLFFLRYPAEIFMVHHGGLAWHGGLLGGAATAWFLIKKKSLPPALILDLFAPYIALAQAIGRIGCFLNGCCYGRPVSWGVFFPVHGARLHPTQLYSAAGLLCIFFILKAYQKKTRGSGYVFTLYLLLASGQRFIIEYLRGDQAITVAGLSIAQIISACIFAVGWYAHIRLNRRSR